MKPQLSFCHPTTWRPTSHSQAWKLQMWGSICCSTNYLVTCPGCTCKLWHKVSSYHTCFCKQHHLSAPDASMAKHTCWLFPIIVLGKVVFVDHLEFCTPGLWCHNRKVSALLAAMLAQPSLLVTTATSPLSTWWQPSSPRRHWPQKKAFEQFATTHGVAIKQYHCDNGRFAKAAFQQSAANHH